jgi:phosphoserine phosphatase
MREVAEELLGEHRSNTYLFSRLLLEAAKKEGYLAVAISGSPKQIVEPFAKDWGFDDCVGTEFRVTEDGHLTGKMDEWIHHYKNKAAVLERFVEKHGCTWEGSIAIGDSMDDAGMLKRVDYPIAMNPSNDLRAVCREAGIPMALEQGDSVILLRPANKEGLFQEVDIASILPSAIAALVHERSEKRVCRLGS